MGKRVTVVFGFILVVLLLSSMFEPEEFTVASNKVAATMTAAEVSNDTRIEKMESLSFDMDPWVEFSSFMAKDMLKEAWGWNEDEAIKVRIQTVKEKNEEKMYSIINLESSGKFVITLPRAERRTQERLFMCVLIKPLGEPCYWKDIK